MASLSSAATPFQKTLTQLLTDAIAKRAITVKGNQAEPLFESLKQLQSGKGAFQESFLTQIPSQFASQVPKGEAPAAPASLNIDGGQVRGSGEILEDPSGL
jgi:hypothetical protein